MLTPMEEITFSHGPWIKIFSGNWTGYEMALLENPDKMTLTVIYDKEGTLIKGAVLILNRYYVCEGEPTKLSATLGGFSLAFEKSDPSGRLKYFVLSSGPKYATWDQYSINEVTEAAWKEAEEKHERTVELARGFGVTLVELKNAGKEAADRLFSEPLVLPGIVDRAAQPERSLGVGIRASLGKKITGENAEEDIGCFVNTLLLGPAESRKRVARLLAEACVTNRVNVLVFDEDGTFAKMDLPNRGFDFREYPGLQPVGLPLKNVELSADLGLIDSKVFAEILGIGGETGKDAAEFIFKALDDKGVEANSLSDVTSKILAAKEDVKKFHVYKAVRLLAVIERNYPKFFNGKTDIGALVPIYMRSMGTISRINVSGMEESFERLLAFSVMRSLQEHYKRQPSGEPLKTIAFFVNGAKFFQKSNLTDAFLATLSACNSVGIGFCFGAEHEIDIEPDIAKSSTLRVEFVTAEEAAVKPLNGRAYRMKFRPALAGG